MKVYMFLFHVNVILSTGSLLSNVLVFLTISLFESGKVPVQWRVCSPCLRGKFPGRVGKLAPRSWRFWNPRPLKRCGTETSRQAEDSKDMTIRLKKVVSTCQHYIAIIKFWYRYQPLMAVDFKGVVFQLNDSWEYCTEVAIVEVERLAYLLLRYSQGWRVLLRIHVSRGQIFDYLGIIHHLLDTLIDTTVAMNLSFSWMTMLDSLTMAHATRSESFTNGQPTALGERIASSPTLWKCYCENN